MPRAAFKNCRGCGRSSAEVGELSWTRQCSSCGQRRFDANLAGMLTMRGPFAQHWRKQMAACVGGAIMDDPQTVGQSGVNGS